MLSRRRVLGLGGGVAALLLVPPAPAGAGEAHTIRMLGDATGAHVGFDPVGLRIRPGETVRWLNADAGNAQPRLPIIRRTSTGRGASPRRPTPWDSDYLLPDESFAVTLTAEGVYDYYCVPHEHAGMVGRIIVGNPDADPWMQDPPAGVDLPEVALNGFPPVAEIMGKGIVRRA